MTLATMATAAGELTEPASSLSTSGAMTRCRLLSGTMLESSIAVCASCGNGALDGSEIDVDCGGLYCDKCADGAACTKHGDCAGGQCTLLASAHSPRSARTTSTVGVASARHGAVGRPLLHLVLGRRQ